MKKPLWIVLGLVVLAGGGIGIWQWRKHVAAGAAPRFETVAVDRGPIVAKVTATGTLSALVTVQVGTQVSGRIKQINVDFNSPVKKGQVIAKIEPALFEAALESARANYLAGQGTVAKLEAQADNAKVQYDRAVALFDRKAIAQADLDTARATMKAANGDVTAARGNMEQAKAALHQAQVNLDYTTIISPTTGVVISRSVDVGQTVAASLSAPTLFLIAEDLTKMQVDTSVAEADIGKLKADMDATFTVDAYPSRTFKGKIRQIRNAPQTQQNVVTYDAVIDVANPGLELRPGMTANITFIYDHRDSALRVANAALRFQPPPELARTAFGGAQRPGGGGGGGQRPGGGATGDGGGQRRPGGGGRGARGDGETPDRRTVWVLRGPMPTPVRVRAGVSDGANTEIETSELHEGDRVVTDAEFSGGDKSGGQPAGAGAFRRMF
ncbi:MAG TPA: efflux RND transporter periplasmic adaptor subunit [Polyangia bacterium]|nr:efflux RND transporter periplasmic adaptor subunit [Polyangia bacterium]